MAKAGLCSHTQKRYLYHFDYRLIRSALGRRHFAQLFSQGFELFIYDGDDDFDLLLTHLKISRDDMQVSGSSVMLWPVLGVELWDRIVTMLEQKDKCLHVWATLDNDE